MDISAGGAMSLVANAADVSITGDQLVHFGSSGAMSLTSQSTIEYTATLGSIAIEAVSSGTWVANARMIFTGTESTSFTSATKLTSTAAGSAADATLFVTDRLSFAGQDSILVQGPKVQSTSTVSTSMLANTLQITGSGTVSLTATHHIGVHRCSGHDGHQVNHGHWRLVLAASRQ
jgi:hypothetical protein